MVWLKSESCSRGPHFGCFSILGEDLPRSYHEKDDGLQISYGSLVISLGTWCPVKPLLDIEPLSTHTLLTDYDPQIWRPLNQQSRNTSKSHEHAPSANHQATLLLSQATAPASLIRCRTSSWPASVPSTHPKTRSAALPSKSSKHS